MKRGYIVLETLLFGLLSLWYLGPQNIWDSESVLGRETRDLYDHLALLDCWSLHVSEWSFPGGGTLVPPDLYSMLLAAPFMSFGRGVAFDMALWLQIWLCCIAGAHLGRKVGSGLVGGIAFGFSPYLLGQVFSGETETLSAWPLLFMTSMMLSNPRSLWVGFWGAAAALGSWYYGAYAVIILFLWAAIVGKWFRKGADRTTLRPLIFLAALVAGPALLYLSVLQDPTQMFRGPVMSEYIEAHPRALAAFSTDPTVWFGRERVDVVHQSQLGMLSLLLAAWGAVLYWRRPERWGKSVLLVLAFALCMSLGPMLHWNGRVIWSWMPYRIFMEVPPFGLMRLPHRWMVVAWIAMSILIVRAAKGLPIMWGALLVFEHLYLSAPKVHTVSIQSPAIQTFFKGPVLELPARMFPDDLRGRYLLWQREHQQPVAYSLLMQGWSPQLDSEPLLIASTAQDRLDSLAVRSVEAKQFRKGDFAIALQEWQLVPRFADVDGAKMRLQAMGFRHVCLYPSFLHPQDAVAMQRLLESSLGVPDIETDEAVLWTL